MTHRILVAGLAGALFAGQLEPGAAGWRVLPPVTQDNLTIFPVVAADLHDTSKFLTLDEGLRSGKVVVTERGAVQGLVRPHPGMRLPRPWPEIPDRLPGGGAEVNRLVLLNNSDRPLILLAGEIVTGGKQDRQVGKDRIVPPGSDAIDLDVFCVEPHRWTSSYGRFDAFQSAMAQPSVRQQAMAKKSQQSVWNEVGRARGAMIAAAPPPVQAEMQAGSSYAGTMGNRVVQSRIDEVTAPLERSYGKLLHELRAQNAAGVVVAVNGEIIWADVFASPELLNAYWPKLIRSYAAEALSAPPYGWHRSPKPGLKDAQLFLDDFTARRESVDSEPGVYRNTEMMGADFTAFVLTSLLPGSRFNIHSAKMRG